MIFLYFYVLTGLLLASFLIIKLKSLGVFPLIVAEAKKGIKIKNQSDEDVGMALITGIGIVCVAIWPFVLFKILYGD